MKQALFLLAGVVVGFMLGGIQPRRELADERAQISRLQDELLKAERRGLRRSAGRSVLPGLDGMLGSDAEEDLTEGADDGSGSGPEVDPEGAEDTRLEPSRAASSDRSWGDQELEQFDLAAEAQRVRARQNRAALAEQAELSEAELQELDGIVSDMNEALVVHAEELLEVALTGEEPSAAEFLGISHDVTGILYDGQVALEDLVGDEGMGTVDDPEGQIWNYLDLDTFRPAMVELVESSEAGGGGDLEPGGQGPGGRGL